MELIHCAGTEELQSSTYKVFDEMANECKVPFHNKHFGIYVFKDNFQVNAL